MMSTNCVGCIYYTIYVYFLLPPILSVKFLQFPGIPHFFYDYRRQLRKHRAVSGTHHLIIYRTYNERGLGYGILCAELIKHLPGQHRAAYLAPVKGGEHIRVGSIALFVYIQRAVCRKVVSERYILCGLSQPVGLYIPYGKALERKGAGAGPYHQYAFLGIVAVGIGVFGGHPAGHMGYYHIHGAVVYIGTGSHCSHVPEIYAALGIGVWEQLRRDPPAQLLFHLRPRHIRYYAYAKHSPLLHRLYLRGGHELRFRPPEYQCHKQQKHACGNSYCPAPWLALIAYECEIHSPEVQLYPAQLPPVPSYDIAFHALIISRHRRVYK